jgi:hypothetical protein
MFTLQVQSGRFYPILSYVCSQVLIKECGIRVLYKSNIALGSLFNPQTLV